MVVSNMYRRTRANSWMDIIMCHNIRAVGAPPHWGGVGWTRAVLDRDLS